MAKPTHDRVLLALLRGINVGGNKRVPMAALRELATGIGLTQVATYIASGNLICTTDQEPEDVEARLEAALAHHFGFRVEVIVRSTEAWHAYAAGSPYPDAEREHPNLLYLGVAKRPLAPGAEDALRRLCNHGERVAVIGEALWLEHGGAGAGPRSKLTPVAIDRAAGSTVTLRNWRTVTKLAELTL